MRIDHTLWVWIQGIHDVEGEWLQLYEEQITIVKDGREQPLQRGVAHGLGGHFHAPHPSEWQKDHKPVKP